MPSGMLKILDFDIFKLFKLSSYGRNEGNSFMLVSEMSKIYNFFNFYKVNGRLVNEGLLLRLSSIKFYNAPKSSGKLVNRF